MIHAIINIFVAGYYVVQEAFCWNNHPYDFSGNWLRCLILFKLKIEPNQIEIVFICAN